MRLDVLVEAALGQGHGVDAVGHHLLDGLGVVLLVANGFLLSVPPLKIILLPCSSSCHFSTFFVTFMEFVPRTSTTSTAA